MALMRRATKKLSEAGISLQVIKGMYGFRLENPTFKKQRCRNYKTAEEAVTAAISGDRPINLEVKTEQ